MVQPLYLILSLLEWSELYERLLVRDGIVQQVAGQFSLATVFKRLLLVEPSQKSLYQCE
jgi:hypothetical protein